jgi:hypothetical protein
MFQSRGERKIAAFLDSLNIQYTYQPPVMIKDRGYDRIWYPDFGLNKYGIYIEYFGMQNDPSYDRRTRYKLDAYRKAGLDVISLYPSDLTGHYERYILKEIVRTISGRLSDLEGKIDNFPYRETKSIRNLFSDFVVIPNRYSPSR